MVQQLKYKHHIMSNHNNRKQVLVGLSGGVDSAIAAYLLKEQGYQVAAVFMKNWEETDTQTPCTYTQDLLDAQQVCELLDIELTCINFAEEYWQQVFTYFLQEYQRGRTPNPDICCNKEIKFKAFLNYAQKRGADYIATGHYVRTQHETDLYLLKGKDPLKDQSYFLHTLDKSQLAFSLFPIGSFTKTDVRALAKQVGFKNHAKKDSTGICFIGERRFKSFLSNYLPANPGAIQTLAGDVIGQHDGLMFYTIGQRQGLRIGGQASFAELPWYVVHKDIQHNILYVAQGEDPALYKTTIMVSNLHWINQPLHLPHQTVAKIRYRQPDQPCVLSSEGRDETHCQVTFAKPQRAVAPGQSIVFYQDDICLGGGIIECSN